MAGAKAANATEIEALQRFIDEIDAIDWPAGSFEGQANTLRDHLSGQIEFDRRQTDVATAADIVRAPDAGTPEWLAARAAYDALWKALVQRGPNRASGVHVLALDARRSSRCL